MHAPLTNETSAHTGLRELVSLIVLPFSPGAENVSIEGNDVMVSGASIRPLGLALHELATNAAKFGALSSKEGHVTLSWRTDLAEDGDVVRIVWSESGGPEVEAPLHRGFGSTLIEQTLPYELAGEVALEFPRTGVRCEFILPVREGLL
jgi:two-component sensor histidine kinase